MEAARTRKEEELQELQAEYWDLRDSGVPHMDALLSLGEWLHPTRLARLIESLEPQPTQAAVGRRPTRHH